jgi:N-acetylneuraminic acid mutarotase
MLRIVIFAIGALAWIGECLCVANEPEPPAPGAVDAIAWERLADLPDARGVAGAFAGVCGSDDGGWLVVAGGANFPDRPPWAGGAKAWHDAAWVLAEPGGRWEQATPLPAPLGYGVSATFGGRVWCVGGCDAKRHVASTVALGWDASTHRLTVEPNALPALPKPVAYAAGVVVGSRLYIAGGQETPDATDALGTLWSIDLAAAAGLGRTGSTAQSRWQEHPPYPGPPRILPVLGTHAGRVVLVSGAELVAAPGAGTAGVAAVTRRFLRDAYAFDPQTHTWTVLAAPPVPIVAAAGPAIPVGGGRLAFLPGDDGALFEQRAELAGRHPGFPRAILLYDTSADAWHAAGEIPGAVAGTATATPVTTPAVAWRGRTVIPSGETQPGVRTPAVLSLSATSR